MKAVVQSCLLALLMILVLAGTASAVTIDDIGLSPSGNITTTATLSCLVTASGSGTLAANITWFRNGAAHSTDNETIALTSGTEGSTSAPGNVEAADTAKGQSWLCQATVGNGTNATSMNSSAVIISNSPPQITVPTTTQLLDEDDAYSLTANATDADGDSIVQYISSDLNASLYNNTPLFTIGANGLLSFTPTQAATGNHTMAILAYDGEQFGGLNVLFTVSEVDDAPFFLPTLLNQSALVGDPFSYTATLYDEEGDTLNVTMSASSPNILLNQSGPTTAIVSFIGSTPEYSDRGLHQVNLTVYQLDNASRNSTSSFWINVSSPNRDPVLQVIANQTGVQGGTIELYVNASDNDTEDTLLFEITPSCTLANPWNITTLVNTSNATGLINVTLTNDHVVCNDVTITVSDYEGMIAEGGGDSQLVHFNITNTNDAPTVHNTSMHDSNFKDQQDLRDLIAYTFVPFTYMVNATDPDMLTYEGDTLTYTDNTTLFAINSSTGSITFTPDVGDAGNYLVNITVNDTDNTQSSAVLNITIVSNFPPQLTSVPTIICQEDSACMLNFSAGDTDLGENLTFTSNDTILDFTQLTYNVSLFNRTYTNDDVGNYTVLVTVTDVASHTNMTNVTLIINNTNDAPFFDGNQDGINDSQAMPAPVVVDRATTWLLNVTDVDLQNVAENLTITAVIESGPNSSLFALAQLNMTQARIQFTPTEADIGDYSMNITVVDLAGANESHLVNFTVHNISQAPVITAVQPFNNGSLQTNGTLSATAATSTTVTFPENTTVTYNLSYTDADTLPANVTVRYYLNGVLVQTSNGSLPAYTVSYGFFSAGSYALTAVVEDYFFSNDTFSWDITITDVNRPPVFTPTISNRTINATVVLVDEMENFLDPDDDANSNGLLDGAETNSLAFTMTTNDYLAAVFTDRDVELAPQRSGVALVTYTATDAGGLQTTSHNVTYTVFYDPQEVVSTSGGGGGGGGGGSSSVPQRVPTPQPYAIELLTPKPLTVYVNETIVAPFIVNNTGQSTLSGISLSAESEAELNFSFSEAQLSQLESGESREVLLTIEGFRNAGTVEVVVTAGVLVPSFNDTAVIFINSLEQKKEGEETASLKVTYARDFLADNPACGELVQLVDQAERAYANGDPDTAAKMLDAVTEGCAYLKSQVAEEIQVPSGLQRLAGYKYINVMLGGALLILLISGGLLLVHYGRQQ